MKWGRNLSGLRLDNAKHSFKVVAQLCMWSMISNRDTHRMDSFLRPKCFDTRMNFWFWYSKVNWVSRTFGTTIKLIFKEWCLMTSLFSIYAKTNDVVCFQCQLKLNYTVHIKFDSNQMTFGCWRDQHYFLSWKARDSKVTNLLTHPCRCFDFNKFSVDNKLLMLLQLLIFTNNDVKTMLSSSTRWSLGNGNIDCKQGF